MDTDRLTSPPPAGRTQRPRGATLVATAGGIAAAGLTLATSLALFSPPGDDGSAAPAATSSYTTPPADEVRRVHDALDDIAERCTPDADSAAVTFIDRDVEVILAFARTYPNAEFPIHDETGHTLSLLLAVRDDLGTCAPTAAARVDAALPAQFRQPSAPSGTEPS